MSDGRGDILLLAGIGLLAYAAWNWLAGSMGGGDGGSSGEGGSNLSAETITKIAGTYADAIGEASATYDVRAGLIVGVIAQESGGDPNAVGDGGQARGLMQMHPAAASDAGFDWASLFDPTTAIMAGTAYLGQQLARFGGDETMALIAYNQGPGVASAGPSDPRFATGRAYAASVLNYAAIADGGGAPGPAAPAESGGGIIDALGSLFDGNPLAGAGT